MKTILIPRHSVPIILIIELNMLCINVLNCTHNVSMDRKFEVHPYACLKSLLHLMWNLELYLWIMRIVNHSIFINGT